MVLGREAELNSYVFWEVLLFLELNELDDQFVNKDLNGELERTSTVRSREWLFMYDLSDSALCHICKAIESI